MSRYRVVHSEIWLDDKFPYLSDDGKAVWFHAFTTTFNTGIGAYHASIDMLAAQNRWPAIRYRQGIEYLAREGLLRFDDRAQMVWFPKYFKRNKPANPKHLKGLLSVFDTLPQCGLKKECFQSLREQCKSWGSGFSAVVETFSEDNSIPYGIPYGIPHRHGMPNQDSGYRTLEQEQEQEKRLAEAEAASEPIAAASNGAAAARGNGPVPACDGKDFPETGPARLPNCPHAEILDLWAEILPTLPQPKRNLWNGAGERQLAARWKQGLTTPREDGAGPWYHDKPSGLAWWRRLFAERIKPSDFLVHQCRPMQTEGLRWATRAEPFRKIIEGNYA